MSFGGKANNFLDPLGLFTGGEKAAPPPTPAPAPVMQEKPDAPDMKTAQANVDANLRDQEDAARKRKGRAATMFTGEGGAGLPNSAAKALTGE